MSPGPAWLGLLCATQVRAVPTSCCLVRRLQCGPPPASHHASRASCLLLPITLRSHSGLQSMYNWPGSASTAVQSVVRVGDVSCPGRHQKNVPVQYLCISGRRPDSGACSLTYPGSSHNCRRETDKNNERDERSESFTDLAALKSSWFLLPCIFAYSERLFVQRLFSQPAKSTENCCNSHHKVTST